MLYYDHIGHVSPILTFFLSFTSLKGAENLLKAHIFLIGMDGTGKSSLGQRLAQNLGWPFLDTEQRVCQLTGMNSREELSASLGEDFCLNAETGLLISLVGKTPQVVATSQAVCHDDLNVKIMRNHGIVICIHKPLNVLLKALGNRGTPSDEEYDRVIRAYHRESSRFTGTADATVENVRDFQSAIKNLTDTAQNLLKD